MWITVTKDEFNFIAKTLRHKGKGYEWHSGDYTSIKLTMKDWEQEFPHYLPKSL